MKKPLFVAFLALLLALVVVGVASADGGPHGGYTTTTDACAGCHRAHTAIGPKLLVASSSQALCMVCHGSTGTGADTNVLDGIYLDRDAVTESPAEGVANRGLKGGGFVNALMDTNWDNTASSAGATSVHTRDGSAGTLWGNGAIGSGAGPTSFSLSCANCHDPHGTGTYRILRKIPTGSGAGSQVSVADETPKTYSVSSTLNQYYGESYGTRGQDLASWCSQCHTRYLAASGSGSTASGDAIFAYRHMSNASGVNCVTCHVAHGTAAAMGTFSGSTTWPDGATTPNGNARSSLLRVDNRGVCELCHNK